MPVAFVHRRPSRQARQLSLKATDEGGADFSPHPALRATFSPRRRLSIQIGPPVQGGLSAKQTEGLSAETNID